MATYTTERNLPACRVEKRLLAELEEYILRRAGELGANESYEVTIKDATGEEELPTITEFRTAYFPSTTKEISLSYGLPITRALHVSLVFALGRNWTANLRVSYSDTAPREIVTGIATEILSIIGNYRTLYYLFHPGVAMTLVLLSIVTILATVALALASGKGEAEMLLGKQLLLLLASTLFLYLLLGRLLPYSMFETRRNESVAKWGNWLLFGFLGFVLFSVVGVIFRRRILGF